MNPDDRQAVIGVAVLLGVLAVLMLLAGIWVSDLSVTQRLFATGGVFALLGAFSAWDSSAVIPKVIHRVWVGGEEPEWQRGFRSTWEQEGWELRQWGDEEVAELELRNQRAYDAARGRFVGQLRSDILRYEILHRFGGVYVDADFECRRPLAELEEMVDGARCFAAWEEQNVWVNNALMGCEPEHPFLDELIERLPASIARTPHARPTVVTGPQFLTGIYLTGFTDEVRVLPQALFYPYLWNELDREGEEFPNAFAVHHWGNRRRERWQTA